MRRTDGFTLAELAIVLAIIGLLLGMYFLRGQAEKDSSVANDVVAMQKDLIDAIREFKHQYNFLPGDLPNAGRKIGAVPEICDIHMINNNIGNGLIDTPNEVQCVPDELKLSGLFNANLVTDGLHVFITSNGNQLTVLAASIAHVPTISSAPLLPQTVIEVANLPCDSAKAVDKRLDDGNLGTGNIQVAAAFVNCVSGTEVPYLDIAF